MARDLFAETVNHRSGPRRSKWTLAGSIAAHVAVVAVLIVAPLTSLLDDIVIHASDLVYKAPPIVVAAQPARPPRSATPVPPEVKPNAAPSSASQEPVKNEVTPPSGPPGPPGMPDIFGRGGSDVTGLFDPRERVVELPPPPAPPKPMKPIPVGGAISAPAKTYSVDPIYPQIAIAAKQEGTVILEATIDESGIVRNLKVLRSYPLLDQAAINAVSKWRYTPTKLNGVPVPIILTVTVTFSLR